VTPGKEAAAYACSSLFFKKMVFSLEVLIFISLTVTRKLQDCKIFSDILKLSEIKKN